MSAKLYPFIDIAVHERVREHFARGDAAVLFSADMGQVLWSNGEGAALFGMPSIYDFIDSGAETGDVAFRQMEATARQLMQVGDIRSFLIRIGTGFRRMPVNALVEMISVHPGEKAILFTAPGNVRARTTAEIARTMISGFDDPDTHMAVLDGDGGIVAASQGFGSLAMTPQTCRALVTAVSRDSDWLVKRPVPTGKGHLPAAIGKLSETPALHLLFAVETILGNLDPGADFDEEPRVENALPSDFDEPAATIEEPLAISESTAMAPAETSEDSIPTGDDDAIPAAFAETDRSAAAETIEIHASPEEFESEAFPTPQIGSAVSEPEATFDPVAADAEVSAENEVAGDTLETQSNVPDAEDALSGIDVAADTSGAATRPEADDNAEAVAEVLEPETSVPGNAAEEETDLSNETVIVEATGDAAAETAAPAMEEQDRSPEDIVVSAEPREALVEPAALVAAEDLRAGDSTDGFVAPAEPDTPETGSQARSLGFVFDLNSRAVRFVWKIDSDGRFREISDEFAMAVGPASADITGVTFSEIAERYHLDPDGKIGDLLKRRDTWSGKTILWPVEGTSLQVPVDLAALPTYSRNREFDGFRGFGIVRVADAIEDHRGTGLTLGLPLGLTQAEPVDPDLDAVTDSTGLPSIEEEDIRAPAGTDDGAADEALPPAEANGEEMPAAHKSAISADDDAGPLSDEAEEDRTVGEMEDLFADLEDETHPGMDAVEPAGVEDPFEDPFRGERPALQLVENPGRRTSDKVVRLDNHRPQGIESLTRGEQAAFREIARQLGESFGKRQDGPPAAETDGTADSFEPEKPLETTKDDAALPPTAETPAVADEGTSDDVASLVVAEDAAASPMPEEESAQSVVETDETVDALPIRTNIEAGGLNPELLDGLPVALLVHAGDELFHANPEFLTLTGFASLEALREEGGIDALFVAEEDGIFDMPDGTMMMIRNDGRLIPVKARLQSIRWEGKGALMMALSASAAEAQPAKIEATQEQAESPAVPAMPKEHEDIQTLRMEAEELRSILETATDGVAIVGADGEIRSLNRSASALFNYDDGEIRGKPFAMLFAHESQKAVIDYLGGLSGHGVASVLNDGREVIGREASGGFIPLFMTMGRLASSNGYCAVIRDITQWKRTEEELRNAKRAAETANAHKTDFLARVSHEIRTPLNAIIGFSDMMASEHFGAIGNPRYVEYANDIGRSGRHVLDIVNDLLDISKIEAGEMDLEFTAVEINDAVSEAVSLVQPQANSQRVIIRTSLSGSVPNIVADSRSIKQIALNILSNAIRFTPSGGQIVVSTAYEANGSVILRIRDTGIGMTRTELEQAMKPFRQVTTGTRKRGDGTGLGLPLTKAMAEANRAQFSINSAPNEGTLVEISFPSQRVLAD